jgi:inhibitor of the pro-sigma K processing machinery
MGIGEKLAFAVFGIFLLLSLLRLFAAPLRLAFRAALNALVGFAALFMLNLAAPLTGLSLGLNLMNALTVGILGLPGLILLVLLQTVFV